MAVIQKVTFKLRRGLASEWASINPILSDGEPAFELDSLRFKIGDGVAAYNDLPYMDAKEATETLAILMGDSDGSIKQMIADAVAALVNSAPETLDTLGELATAFEDN